MSTLVITVHAVQQFVLRHAPTMSMEEARRFLESNWTRATRIKERTILGQAQWVLPSPKCVLVIKHDHKLRAPVCVTVLPTRKNMGIVEPPTDPYADEEYDSEVETSEAQKALEDAVAAIPKQTAKESVEVKPRGTLAPSHVHSIKQSLPEARAKREEFMEIQRIALERDRLRTERHLNKLNDENVVYKGLVRSTLRFLLRKAAEKDAEAMELLETIQEVDAGLVSMGFLGPRE